MASPKRPKAPRNTYWRGGTLWAKFTVAGVTVRTSLHTSDPSTASRRVKEQIDREKAARHFGEVVLDWEKVVALWADHIAQQVAAQTAARYASSLEQCRPWLTGLSVNLIDRATIQRVVTERRAAGVKNATIKRDLTAVSSVLEYAIGQGWIEANPALVVSKRIGERRDPIVLPTEQNISYLISRLDPLWRDFMVAARLTGLRISELTSIRHRDLNATGKTLYVPKAKGNKPRTIDLTDEAVAVLARQPKGKCEELFHADGQPLKFASSRFKVKGRLAHKAAQKAGQDFSRFRFHDLRHLYAVEYLRKGGSIYMLQQQLGHASITTTEGYLRFLTPEQAKKAKQMG
jgi:integrase/recombinase XerD